MGKKHYSRPQAEVRASRLRMTILAGSKIAGEVDPMPFDDDDDNGTTPSGSGARTRMPFNQY